MEKIKLAQEGGIMVIPDTTGPGRRNTIPTGTHAPRDQKTEQDLDQELTEQEIWELLKDAEQPDGTFDL